jgi:hypothetical protein
MPLAFTPSFDTSLIPCLKNAMQAGTAQVVFKAGRNPACATSAFADLWSYPGIAAGQPLRNQTFTPYSMAVISDSTADVAVTGTGARTIGVAYLDGNYDPHTAVFALNGQTAVTTALSIDGGAGGAVTNVLRIQATDVLTAGTGFVNAGNIYVCDATNTYSSGVPVNTALVYDCVYIGYNTAASCYYTIPRGYQGIAMCFLPAINDTTATPKYGKIRLCSTNGSDGIFRNFDIGGITSNCNPHLIYPPCYPVLPEKSDVRVQAQVSASTIVGCETFFAIWPKS